MILAICFGVGIDVIASYFIGIYFDTGYSPLVVAVGLPVVVYAIAWIYSIYTGLKEIVWFILFERKGRIDMILSQMLELNFPVPESEYDNADDYFTKISLRTDLPPKTALIAGQMMGIRYKRPFIQTICTNIAVEKAIERYRLTRQAAKASA